MNQSDAQLIASYLDGDEESLSLLVCRYLKSVYLFVFKYVGNVQDAEDIAQEVFARVWHNLEKFDPEKNFKTWLLNIAKNAAIDFLRKKKTLAFSDFKNAEGENSLGEIVDPAPLPEEIFARKDLARELEEAIGKIPIIYRPILHLYYNEQLTFQEIADALGEPLNTVKSRHRRALILLRKELNFG